MAAENTGAGAAASAGAGRSSNNATADSYIGSLISLTSKSEIRYEGVLYNINTDESSIGLKNVRSFGTEGRKKDGPQIPPSDKVYEYILFRGSDIKDLQVKSSPPVQPAPPPPVHINNDPAIIQQSHYPRPATAPTSLPTLGSGVSLSDVGSHNAQMGLPGSNFQTGMPSYQPGGNLGTWGGSPAPPPNPNGSGLAMPMYWPGYYGPSTGLPHLHQQSMFRPPPGLSIPPPMQQPMQFPSFNAPLPSGASNLPGSNLPTSNFPGSNMPTSNFPGSNMPTSNFPGSNMPTSNFPGSNMPTSNFPGSNIPTSNFPGSNLPNSNFAGSTLPTSNYPGSNLLAPNVPGSNLPVPNLATSLPDMLSLLPASTGSLNFVSTSQAPLSLPSTLAPVAPITSDALSNLMPNKAPSSALPSANLTASTPTLSPLTTSSPDLSAIVPPILSKPSGTSGPAIPPYQASGQSTSSAPIASSSIRSEAPTHALVTPGQLLQSGPATVSSSPPVEAVHKDVEVVQVSSSSLPKPLLPVPAEAQPPILPLPAPSRPAYKPNGAPFHNRHGYRGRERGRGPGSSRPVAKFTEDFDFEAMNEKFNKDEVWGHLGKSKNSRDKEDGNISDDDGSQDEYDDEYAKVDSKQAVYNKDDFFDTLSCNTIGNDPQTGRPKFSEQMKIDTETFGEFSRYRGGRGGRGPPRGGRSRGSYNGRGGYGYGQGYGYTGRGRGRAMPSRAA